MKLRWYDRILVALSGLVLIALGVCVILAAGGVIDLPAPLAFDSWLGDGWQWMPLVFLAGALIVVWGLWLFIRPFRRGSEPGGRYYVLKGKDDGDVKISVHAIDHLVQKSIGAYGQVAGSKVKIGGKEDAMQITLHLTVRSDVNIPMLVDDVREDIVSSLEQSAGVHVEHVSVYVDATKDDKGDAEVKYLEAHGRPTKEEPVEEPINTASFYTTPVVVTGDSKPRVDEPILSREPTMEELKREVDLGPDEPLPVELSAQAFPFPEREAGVPLEIYTSDVPIKNDTAEEAERDE